MKGLGRFLVPDCDNCTKDAAVEASGPLLVMAGKVS